MGKRILVADDSLTIQKAFAMVLGGQDYTLLTARSVDEALVSAKGARPDLIIADAVLGSGSGYDLCASVKAEPALGGATLGRSECGHQRRRVAQWTRPMPTFHPG
jgi:CheY-like chemotaxis protein